MDISSFMTGYFVGFVVGAGFFIWWTYTFGRFLPKEWPFTRQKIANGVRWLLGRRKQEVAFASRRENRAITPAE